MVMKTRRSRATVFGLAATLAAGLLAGCSGVSGADQEADNRITVWSQENLPPRMAATQKVVSRFEKETGVKVDLVGVDEAQLPQLIMSAAAAGKLPDVIGAVPMGQVWQMYGNGLLNTEVADKIVKDLHPDTFNSNALSLTEDHGTRLGVPSDAWLQLVVYRKDLFAKAGLKAPDSYASALKAAAALDSNGRYGVSSPPIRRTSSPSRASRTWRWRTTASSWTDRANQPSTHRPVARPSPPTTTWHANMERQEPRAWTPPAPPTSPASPP